MLRRLYRASIWHPDSIPVEEWKYRNLKRVWLPLYDLLAMWAGLNAFLTGTELLNRLFGATLVDYVGLTFFMVAFVCLLGVAFPRLWAIEIIGKSLLVGMVLAYVAAILFFPSRPDPNFFIISMLFWGIPLALFRLNLLGEEWKERRAKRVRAALRAVLTGGVE